MDNKRRKRKFTRQDYFRYARIGTSWRRPRGRQSKMRKMKSGSGRMPNKGYGTPAGMRNKIPFDGSYKTAVRVYKPADVDKITGDCVIIIPSGVGMKKAAEIYDRAVAKKIRVANMKKARKSVRYRKSLAVKKKDKKDRKKDKKDEKKPDSKKMPLTKKEGRAEESKEKTASSDVKKSGETEIKEGNE